MTSPVIALDEELGRRAGVLLGRAGSSDVVDAAVVLLARDGDDTPWRGRGLPRTCVRGWPRRCRCSTCWSRPATVPTGSPRPSDGPHYCLGAHLARIELVEVLGALLTRLPGLRLAVPVGEVVWRRSLIRGPAELPVRW